MNLFLQSSRPHLHQLISVTQVQAHKRVAFCCSEAKVAARNQPNWRSMQKLAVPQSLPHALGSRQLTDAELSLTSEKGD